METHPRPMRTVVDPAVELGKPRLVVATQPRSGRAQTLHSSMAAHVMMGEVWEILRIFLQKA